MERAWKAVSRPDGGRLLRDSLYGQSPCDSNSVCSSITVSQLENNSHGVIERHFIGYLLIDTNYPRVGRGKSHASASRNRASHSARGPLLAPSTNPNQPGSWRRVFILANRVTRLRSIPPETKLWPRTLSFN
jgi:hypothetical protein